MQRQIPSPNPPGDLAPIQLASMEPSPAPPAAASRSESYSEFARPVIAIGATASTQHGGTPPQGTPRAAFPSGETPLISLGAADLDDDLLDEMRDIGEAPLAPSSPRRTAREQRLA